MRCDRRKVMKALRLLDFKRTRGNSGGHQTFADPRGKKVGVKLRKKDIHIGEIYALASELEGVGITRDRFMRTLKSV